jgi:hypothetical protein
MLHDESDGKNGSHKLITITKGDHKVRCPNAVFPLERTNEDKKACVSMHVID